MSLFAKQFVFSAFKLGGSLFQNPEFLIDRCKLLFPGNIISKLQGKWNHFE